MDEEKREDPLDPLIDSFEISVKALMLLSDRDDTISRSDIIRRMENSSSEEVREFIDIIRTARKGNDLSILFSTVGEFLLSAFLFILGIILVVPTFSSGANSNVFFSYYVNALRFAEISSGYFQVALFINFLIALIVLFAGFFTLRTARVNIRYLFR
ncbi:MAG: hypothetical protein M1496_01025 [Candidatus Thermoplasmatota archaeon]|jgi:hypothetical protein|nr:hypothetical protein [Candidatus Thermoplasmatota archaeon]